MRHLRLLVLVGGILVGVHDAEASSGLSARPSYFPLAPGNEWVYSVYVSLLDSILWQDTVRVDDVDWARGKEYFHLTTPWPPVFSVWVRPDSAGDLYWCDSPGGAEHPLLLFSVEPETGWLLGGRFCMDSAVRTSCPPSIQTPMGSFEEVVCLASAWRPGDCYDFYWYAVLAEGVGPVIWRLIGPGGASLEWRLIEAHFAPATACKCHADPLCDGLLDVRDLVLTIDVAFRGARPWFERGCSCYANAIHGPTDVDCSGATDVLDVVAEVDVAFRGGDPLTRFCDPCAL